MDWEALRNYALPIAATGLTGYAVWEASKKYPIPLAASSGMIVGYLTLERVSD